MADITSLFNPNADPLCSIKEWIVSDLETTTKVSALSIAFALTLQAARVSPMGALEIDRSFNISTSDFKSEFSVSVYLRETSAKTNLTILHKYMANLEVNIGCFNVTKLKFSLKPNTNQHLIKFDSLTQVLTMKFPQREKL